MKKIWCEARNVPLPNVDANKKLPKLIRCPKCGKRFKPFSRDCGDGHCYHAYFPKHKREMK